MKEPRITHCCNLWGWHSTPSSWNWSLPQSPHSRPQCYDECFIRKLGNDVLIPIMFWWHFWLKITFSVLTFWYKRVLKQTYRIRPNFIFSSKKKAMGVLSYCTNPLPISHLEQSLFGRDTQDAHLFVVGSLSWSFEAMFLLASFSFKVLHRGPRASKWRKCITAFSYWEISALCINIVEANSPTDWQMTHGNFFSQVKYTPWAYLCAEILLSSLQ